MWIIAQHSAPARSVCGRQSKLRILMRGSNFDYISKRRGGHCRFRHRRTSKHTGLSEADRKPPFLDEFVDFSVADAARRRQAAHRVLDYTLWGRNPRGRAAFYRLSRIASAVATARSSVRLSRRPIEIDRAPSRTWPLSCGSGSEGRTEERGRRRAKEEEE